MNLADILPWKSQNSSKASLPLQYASSSMNMSCSEVNSSNSYEGTLILIVSKAKNLSNRRAISKQNPYCTIRINKHHDRTQTLFRGGQRPEWDHETRFLLDKLDLGSKLKVCVFDDKGNKTEIIGETEVPIKPALLANVDVGYDKWHSIYYDHHLVGEVFIEMTYYPRRGAKKNRSLQGSKQSTSSSRSTPSQSPYSSTSSLTAQSSTSNVTNSDLNSDININRDMFQRSSRPLPKPPTEQVSELDANSGESESENVQSSAPRLDSYLNFDSSLLPGPEALMMSTTDSDHSYNSPPRSAQDVISREINIGYEESLFQKLKPHNSRI